MHYLFWLTDPKGIAGEVKVDNKDSSWEGSLQVNKKPLEAVTFQTVEGDYSSSFCYSSTCQSGKLWRGDKKIEFTQVNGTKPFFQLFHIKDEMPLTPFLFTMSCLMTYQ